MYSFTYNSTNVSSGLLFLTFCTLNMSVFTPSCAYCSLSSVMSCAASKNKSQIRPQLSLVPSVSENLPEKQCRPEYHNTDNIFASKASAIFFIPADNQRQSRNFFLPQRSLFKDDIDLFSTPKRESDFLTRPSREIQSRQGTFHGYKNYSIAILPI